jgi:hypothetical protein
LFISRHLPFSAQPNPNILAGTTCQGASRDRSCFAVGFLRSLCFKTTLQLEVFFGLACILIPHPWIGQAQASKQKVGRNRIQRTLRRNIYGRGWAHGPVSLERMPQVLMAVRRISLLSPRREQRRSTQQPRPEARCRCDGPEGPVARMDQAWGRELWRYAPGAVFQVSPAE